MCEVSEHEWGIVPWNKSNIVLFCFMCAVVFVTIKDVIVYCILCANSFTHSINCDSSRIDSVGSFLEAPLNLFFIMII